MAINTGRVVVGGVAAGVVLGVLDVVVNGVLMAERNRAAVSALNPGLIETMESTTSMVAYLLIDLLLGVVLVWTYAAMRPRFGPGPKTAVVAGLQVWGVAMVVYAGMTAMGMWEWSYMAMGGAVYLVVLLVSANAGAFLYRE